MYTRYWQYNFRLLNDLPRRAAHVPLRLDAHGRADSTRTAVRELRLAIAIINQTTHLRRLGSRGRASPRRLKFARAGTNLYGGVNFNGTYPNSFSDFYARLEIRNGWAPTTRKSFFALDTQKSYCKLSYKNAARMTLLISERVISIALNRQQGIIGATQCPSFILLKHTVKGKKRQTDRRRNCLASLQYR